MGISVATIRRAHVEGAMGLASLRRTPEQEDADLLASARFCVQSYGVEMYGAGLTRLRDDMRAAFIAFADEHPDELTPNERTAVV